MWEQVQIPNPFGSVAFGGALLISDGWMKSPDLFVCHKAMSHFRTGPGGMKAS